MRTIASLFLVLLLAPPAFADCSYTGRIFCSGYVNHSAMLSDPTASFDCSQGDLTSNVSFDVPAGRASALATSVGRFALDETVYSEVHDEFVLTGVPDGTVVQVTAVADLAFDNVRVAGRSPTYAYASIFVPRIANVPQSYSVEYPFFASAPGEETETHALPLLLPLVAGSPFELSFSVAAVLEGAEGSSARGQLRFEGLPPGASITSCKGYRIDQPVAAIPVTWGKLKVAYR